MTEQTTRIASRGKNPLVTAEFILAHATKFLSKVAFSVTFPVCILLLRNEACSLFSVNWAKMVVWMSWIMFGCSGCLFGTVV